MEDHGFDSLYPPTVVHIAASMYSEGERMESPIPDSPLSSAPNSAPNSPGNQYPSFQEYSDDADGFDEYPKSLNEGLNNAGGVMDDNVYLPGLDHDKAHRMDQDPGKIPLLSMPSSKSDAPFDERSALPAATPTASAGPTVLSPSPLLSKPKNALWMRTNHYDNDDSDDDDDGLLSPSRRLSDDVSSPVSPLQRRLMKNRRQSAEMELKMKLNSSSSNNNNNNISSSSISITGASPQHINSPNRRKSAADVVDRAKQVMARRSYSALPLEGGEASVRANSGLSNANANSSTNNTNNDEDDDDDDEDIPHDERQARRSPPPLFSGSVGNAAAMAAAIASGSSGGSRRGIVIPLPTRDEQRETPMDEPPPARLFRASASDQVDTETYHLQQQEQAPMDEAEARSSRPQGLAPAPAAATTSSGSFDPLRDDDDSKLQYYDDSFVTSRTIDHDDSFVSSRTGADRPNTAVTVSITATTNCVQKDIDFDKDDDKHLFWSSNSKKTPGSPFSGQQSAVSNVNESFYSSGGSLDEYHDNEIEVVFGENSKDDYEDSYEDEDDPLSGIMDPGQYPRMAAKALVSAQSEFTNFFLGRRGMVEEEKEKLEDASPARSEEPPFLPRKSEPTGGKVVSSALLANKHYKVTATAAAAAITYNSDDDTGFGWVDDLVHESVGLVGMMTVSDACSSFKTAAAPKQLQSDVSMPKHFVPTTVAPKSVDAYSSLKTAAASDQVQSDEGMPTHFASTTVAPKSVAAYSSFKTSAAPKQVQSDEGMPKHFASTTVAPKSVAAYSSFKTSAAPKQVQSDEGMPTHFASSTVAPKSVDASSSFKTAAAPDQAQSDEGMPTHFASSTVAPKSVDAFSSFETAAAPNQVQSDVGMPTHFVSATVAPKSLWYKEQGGSLKQNTSGSGSSCSSGSSAADDDVQLRHFVAKSLEEAETASSTSPGTSPVKKTGKDGVWWLELELSRREGLRKTDGPMGAADKIIAIRALDQKNKLAAGPQAENNGSMRSLKDSQQGKSKPSTGNFWQGVRAKLTKEYDAVMSDGDEQEQIMTDGLGQASGMDSPAKHGTKSAVKPTVLEEPPFLRRSNNAFDGDISFDAVARKNDEPPSLRRFSGNAPSSIKSGKPPSPTVPEDAPCSVSSKPEDAPASLSCNTDDQLLLSNPRRQTGSDGNTALSSDDDDDDASGSMDVLMTSLDEMVKSLEVSTPTRLLERARSNDVEEVKSSSEDSTSNQRVRADPDAFSNGTPILVEPIDNDFGIPIGDTMISLLNEDTDVSWASRVNEAIWRCRTMRRNFDSKYLQEKQDHHPDGPPLGRTSVPVDVDDVRVIGGVGNVPKTQSAAQEHLKYDDFDDALMLYEDIIFSYYRFFDEVLKKSEVGLLEQNMTGKVSDFKPYIGAALHNIGMVHLLKGNYEAAFTHFERAALNRAARLGNGHVDYVTSLVKMATCQFALEDFEHAHSNLEEALSLSGHNTESVLDYRQIAEILNNLGCLSYMGGKPGKAMRLFQESLQAQEIASDDSLYTGTKFSCHSASLNMSIAQGNVGFIALVTRDIPASTAALESALKEQQLLLRDAHVTLISTMDHLVITNMLGGRLRKSLQILRRMLQMQLDAFGPSDMRCLRTANKIKNLQNQEMESEMSDGTLDADPHQSPAKTKKKNVLNVFKSMRKKK